MKNKYRSRIVTHTTHNVEVPAIRRWSNAGSSPGQRLESGASADRGLARFCEFDQYGFGRPSPSPSLGDGNNWYYTSGDPTNPRREVNVVLMLGRRLRRRPNINTPLDKHIVVDGNPNTVFFLIDSTTPGDVHKEV